MLTLLMVALGIWAGLVALAVLAHAFGALSDALGGKR